MILSQLYTLPVCRGVTTLLIHSTSYFGVIYKPTFPSIITGKKRACIGNWSLYKKNYIKVVLNYIQDTRSKFGITMVNNSHI